MKVNNEQLFGFMQEVRGQLGTLIEGQKNMDSHIKAVSGKADHIREELDRHKDSDNAHGIAASGRSYGNVVSWGGLGLALASLWASLHGKNGTP